MNPARKRATYADLLQVPERFVAEIIDGELTTAPTAVLPPRPMLPLPSHKTLVPSPAGRLVLMVLGAGGFSSSRSCTLEQTSLCLILPVGAESVCRVLEDVPYSELAPDWVCEVVSPSTGRNDRVLKMPIYAREQVGHLWLVDPKMRTLEVYRLEGQRWVVINTHGGSGMIRAEPFEALEIDLGRWWLEQEG